MSTSAPGEGKASAFDPVFVIMLVAVLLAVATSITLRIAVTGMGPSKARADNDAPFIHRPIPSHNSAPVSPSN